MLEDPLHVRPFSNESGKAQSPNKEGAAGFEQGAELWNAGWDESEKKADEGESLLASQIAEQNSSIQRAKPPSASTQPAAKKDGWDDEW